MSKEAIYKAATKWNFENYPNDSGRHYISKKVLSVFEGGAKYSQDDLRRKVIEWLVEEESALRHQTELLERHENGELLTDDERLKLVYPCKEELDGAFAMFLQMKATLYSFFNGK